MQNRLSVSFTVIVAGEGAFTTMPPHQPPECSHSSKKSINSKITFAIWILPQSVRTETETGDKWWLVGNSVFSKKLHFFTYVILKEE